MIIDAHTHILPQRRLNGLSIWLDKVFSNHPLAGRPYTEDLIVEELDRNGVRYIFNYVFPMKANETDELNLFNYNLSKKFKNIIPFGSLHIENEEKKSIVDQCIKGFGFFGFKLHPYVQGFSPDDERLFPAYERMEKLGVLINIYTGFEDYYPKREKTIDLPTIEKLIKKFSSLIFILSHMFYPRLSDALYLLENYKNVYMDTTNIFSAIIQDEKRGVNRDNEREIFLLILNKWSKRMVFGTDHPAGMSDVNTIFSDFYSFNLDKEIMQDLLYRTAYELVKSKEGFIMKSDQKDNIDYCPYLVDEENVKERFDEHGNRWVKAYFGGGRHLKNWIEQCKELGEVKVEEVRFRGLKCYEERNEKLYRIWVKIKNEKLDELFIE